MSSIGGGSGAEYWRKRTVMSAGLRVFRESIEERARHAAGLLAAPLSAIVIGVTSCRLHNLFVFFFSTIIEISIYFLIISTREFVSKFYYKLRGETTLGDPKNRFFYYLNC